MSIRWTAAYLETAPSWSVSISGQCTVDCALSSFVAPVSGAFVVITVVM